MRYSIKLKPAAIRELKKLPRPIQRRITRKIDSLANNPRPKSSKKLQGVEDLHRVGVGDYRIIYQVQDKVPLILVARIRHRKDVYRDL